MSRAAAQNAGVESPRKAGLYPTLLGGEWEALPRVLRRLHCGPGVRAHGCFRVVLAGGCFADLLRRLCGLPRPSEASEVRLRITGTSRQEHWRRSFEGHVLRTVQTATRDGRLRERFRGIELTFRLIVEDGAIVYHQERSAIGIGPARMPIPGFLAPHVTAREWHEGGDRVRVTVRVSLPIARDLITYDGWIEVQEAEA